MHNLTLRCMCENLNPGSLINIHYIVKLIREVLTTEEGSSIFFIFLYFQKKILHKIRETVL